MTTIIDTYQVLWEHRENWNKSGAIGEGIPGQLTFTLGLEGGVRDCQAALGRETVKKGSVP